MFLVNVLIPTKTLPNVQYDWAEQPVFNDVIFELPFKVLSLTTTLLHQPGLPLLLLVKTGLAEALLFLPLAVTSGLLTGRDFLTWDR